MLTVHTLVLNEENFLWYSVASVISYVDKVFLWDTGSTDSTLQIIKELIKRWPEKIEFREIGKVDASTLVSARQKMLEETDSGWIMLLDGDEVWWEESIKKVISKIGGSNGTVGIAVPFYNCVGDIFHYQEEVAGKYSIAGRIGHRTLRFARKSERMKILGTYPHEFYTTDDGRPIQESSKIEFVDVPYLHLTHLTRSSRGGKRKEKSELGISFPLDFYYPEVFFRPKPEMVPSVWIKMKGRGLAKALLLTPARQIKRRIW